MKILGGSKAKQNIGWPKDDRLEEEIDIRRTTMNIQHELIEFFGGLPSNEDVYNLMYNNPYLHCGGGPIVQRSLCENCTEYIGPEAYRRKKFNIPILNSFCKRMNTATKHNWRCCEISFKKSVLNHIRKAFERNAKTKQIKKS